MATMTFTAMFTVKPLQKDGHCWPMLHVAPGGTPHMKGVGMLVGKWELNP